ncbi:MAG: hypothetical protein R3E21_03815 [Caenibius sp.]
MKMTRHRGTTPDTAPAKAQGRKKADPLAESGKRVPGPSPDPRTNLALADIALRGVSTLARRAVKRKLLSGYGKKTARDVLKKQTLGQTLTSVIIARIAARSLPGAIIVGVGILGKTLLDRSKRTDRQP